MRFVFLGPPGAGKGTQATRAAAARGIPHVSTGDMMRAAVAAGTSVGKRAKQYLDAGKLVPDEVIVECVRERLRQKDCDRGFLLDGFPRTVAQAEALDRILKEGGRTLGCVIEFVVPERILKERLSSRGATQGRSDDSASVIDGRLKVYAEQTRPLVAFYRAAGRLKTVDGVGELDEVTSRIDAALRDCS